MKKGKLLKEAICSMSGAAFLMNAKVKSEQQYLLTQAA